MQWNSRIAPPEQVGSLYDQTDAASGSWLFGASTEGDFLTDFEEAR